MPSSAEPTVERSGRYRDYDTTTWAALPRKELTKAIALDHIAEAIADGATLGADAERSVSATSAYSIRVHSADECGIYDLTYQFSPTWRL